MSGALRVLSVGQAPVHEVRCLNAARSAAAGQVLHVDGRAVVLTRAAD